MLYEWDLQKDDENFRKHGMRLAEGVAALEDSSSEFWTDDRFDYGEERVITLGRAPNGILFVVSTELAKDLTRIISVRKAEAYEKDWYFQGRP
jgi:uncharacterized protein